MKKCTFKPCPVLISPKKLMCPEHWGLVPRELQSKIYVYAKAYQRINPRKATPEEFNKARSEYYHCVSVACFAVADNLGLVERKVSLREAVTGERKK